MEEKSLPKFFAFHWESACIFMALPISVGLFLNSSILVTSDFFTLLMAQINMMTLLVLITGFLKDWRKILVTIPFLFLVLFNIEHILINEANLNFQFFGLGKSQTFRDSLFTITFFTHSLYFFTGLMICLIGSHFIKINRLTISIIYFLSLLFQIITPLSPLRPNWVNQNLFVENFREFFKTKPPQLTVNSLEKRNENGVTLISPQRKEPRNIVLIILEGFSQYHIEAGYLPHLKSLQEKSFVSNQFVSHQKQTNRGLFSILCGELPNQREFSTKSDLIVSGLLRPKCLPSYLKDLGYENTFLQSAPLVFMAKDRFAKNIDFDYAVGALSFEKEKLISSWGVADEDIFSASLKLLEHKEKKQFLTLLTANTHHPYKTSKGQMTFKQAISHIDSVVNDYVEELKKRELLKNSLVIITSDEAFQADKGLPLHYDNWGLFMAFSNDLPSRKRDQVYGQKNIMDSVLHFLKKERKDGERSIFSEYKSDEGTVFSNIFQKRNFYYYPPNRLLICNFSENCILKKTQEKLFNFFGESNEDSLPLKNALNRIITKSDKSIIGSRTILSLNEISLQAKESKVLISEYKFHSNQNRVGFRSPSKAIPKASAYICGNPHSMRDWNLSNGFFELPQLHKNQDLCLSLEIINPSSLPINLEKVELYYE